MTAPQLPSIVKEFRQDLEAFYQRLQLAPPYDSVEKALACLSQQFESKSQEEQQQIAEDETRRGRLYQQAVIDSGLYKKHRGIIANLLREQTAEDLPERQRYLEEPFLNQ